MAFLQNWCSSNMVGECFARKLILLIALLSGSKWGYCSSSHSTTSTEVSEYAATCSEFIAGDDIAQQASSSCSLECGDNYDPADDRYKLYLVAMGPFPDNRTGFKPGWDVGPSLISAVELALNHINNDTEILPRYKLCKIEADSGCNIESKLTISILRDIYNRQDKQVVGVIGPACSGATLLLAPLTSRQNVSIINITPSATSPVLESAEYNNTFATVSTSLGYIESFFALMKDREWRNVATLHDEERVFFKTTFGRFTERAKNRIRFSLSVHDNEDNVDTRSFPLDDLRESQSRVVFAFVGPATAPRLLCLAYNKSMIFPTYQWIFHDRTRSQLINDTTFLLQGTRYTCTKKDMKRAAHGVILNKYKLRQDEKIEMTGKNYEEYFEEYNDTFNAYLARRNKTQGGVYIGTEFANTYYDATWAMALALHRASVNGLNLSTYTYNQLEETKALRQQLFNLSFNGSSGPIAFNEGTRATNTVINITQLWRNRTDENELESDYLGNFSLNRLILRPGNLSSRFVNSDTFNRVEVRIHIAVSVIIIAITVVLFVLTALLQLAFIGWYHHHTIKATSPNISHLIYSGCYLFSISVFVFAIQETFTYPVEVYPLLYAIFCNTITWCMILGYSLIFGTVLAKSWRVYRIFKHFRNESPGILLTDNALIIFVIILLVVDTCLLVTWNVVDPWTHKQSGGDTTMVGDIPTIAFRSECICKNLIVWVGVVGGYKGIIAIGLVAFSILNRKIRRKDFRHTKKVNILIYSLTMVIAVGMPLYFLLRRIDIHIGFIILCFILNLTVTMCCLMLFIPPVLPIMKKKMGLQEDANLSKEFRRRISSISLISGPLSDSGEYVSSRRNTFSDVQFSS